MCGSMVYIQSATAEIRRGKKKKDRRNHREKYNGLPYEGTKVGLSLGDFVLDRDLPQKGRSPQFSAHVYCGQTAAWTKMPLGTEVGLGLRDSVFDVDPATPRERAHPPAPNFGPCLLCPRSPISATAELLY